MEAFSSIEKTAPKLRVTASEKDHKLVGDILDVKQRLSVAIALRALHDIQQIKEEAQQTFELGLLDLESKAKIDTIYWQLAQQLVNMHRGLRFIPEEVKQLETTLGDQYICNSPFSNRCSITGRSVNCFRSCPFIDSTHRLIATE